MNLSRSQAWSVRLVTALVFFNGLVAMFRPLLMRTPHRLEELVVPDYLQDVSRSVDVVLGITLIYVSLQLLQRKLAAWWIAVLTVVLVALASLPRMVPSAVLVVSLLVLGALLLGKPYFTVKSELRSIRQGVVVVVVGIIIGMGYGTLGFILLVHGPLGAHLGLAAAAGHAATVFALQPLGGSVAPLSRRAQWFVDSLYALESVVVGYGLVSLFRPFDYVFRELPAERAAAAELVERYGRSSEDYFKVWPQDKSYFFTTDGQAVIAYEVQNGVALCLGDPVGRPDAVAAIIGQFQRFCHRQGWSPAYVYVDADNLERYEASGLTTVKIGEDALIDTVRFVTETVRNKHFRNVMNRFDKHGFTTTWHDAPHDRKLINELTRISTAWRSVGGRREWRFIAGTFSTRYMQQGRVLVVRDAKGRALAFANELPVNASGQASIDLMRYVPGAPANLMDFLFARLIADLHDRGVTTFNLGIAPFAGLTEGDPKLEERLMGLVYRVNQSFVAFQGLRRFKNKFDPTWAPRFIAYEGGPGLLPRVGLALAQACRVR